MKRSDPKRAASEASAYEQRWARYLDATLSQAVVLVAPQPGEQILDVGCGTGLLAAKLIEREPRCRVTGVDSDPGMLAVATQRHRDDQRVHLEQADAHTLPFTPGQFDCAISTSAFHYFLFPDQALAEMIRMVKPQGRIVIVDWCADFLTMRFVTLWLRLSEASPLACALWLDVVVSPQRLREKSRLLRRLHRCQWMWQRSSQNHRHLFRCRLHLLQKPLLCPSHRRRGHQSRWLLPSSVKIWHFQNRPHLRTSWCP